MDAPRRIGPSRDKVRGMMVGVGIGDALGMPVEGYSAQRIRRDHPEGIRTYLSGDGHKLWHGTPRGTTTDDTAFTKVVMRSLIEAGGLDIDSQAAYHVAARGMPGGMGRNTKEALDRLAVGISWRESGKVGLENRGAGNGVVMKMAPIAALMAVDPSRISNRAIVEFSAMTHYSRISARASVVHASVLRECLSRTPFDLLGSADAYSPMRDLVDLASRLSRLDQLAGNSSEAYAIDHLDIGDKDISMPLRDLRLVLDDGMDGEAVARRFHDGNGFLVYYNLPFAYAHFLIDPYSIETLYRVVGAGGDTDSNASVVGGMLGALHGLGFFQDHLKDGLRDYAELIELADGFCERFGVD
ncbi:ADP-ribosylglycohydrolase family protein [Singulisphaera sp. PoT]|uniref:ADP-ribosylglycohydrolase family protein n=1 Tax=Singulisphaera sp. PoT TaxID=3411797 RepID=UPI003BF479CF